MQDPQARRAQMHDLLADMATGTRGKFGTQGMPVIERGPVLRAGQWLPAVCPGMPSPRLQQATCARRVSAEFVDVALAPVAEGPRREAGEVLDVVGDYAGPARAEQLVEVLYGLGELDRGTALDAVLR